MKQVFEHIPVMAEEAARLLALPEGAPARLIDGTVGGGGHSALLLKRFPQLEILGIDRDKLALEAAAEKCAFAADRMTLVRGDFGDLAKIADERGWEQVDGVLLDIGVSSPQIDDPVRGFSFRQDGPLDMRMDTGAELTAARVLNTYSAEQLEKVFRDYGEIREARQLARAVTEDRRNRPFETTAQFATLCDRILRRGSRRTGPPAPTLAFQALRIEVNDELGQLRRALDAAMELLTDGGILAVISFHSLEDRIVKHFMADMAVKCKCPPDFPVCVCHWTPQLEILTKKPVEASEAEIRRNPRAACAKLRAGIRIRTNKSNIEQ